MKTPNLGNTEKTARYLKKTGAYLITRVLSIVSHHGIIRGKVNLGKMSGAKGNNNRAARPVERAVQLGLLDQNFDGVAYLYTTSDFGKSVLKCLKGV